jgi:hypothetical protein
MADMDECRAKLPIWGLFSALGLQGADKVGAWGGGGGEAKICSPFREDNSPSFSVYTRDFIASLRECPGELVVNLRARANLGNQRKKFRPSCLKSHLRTGSRGSRCLKRKSQNRPGLVRLLKNTITRTRKGNCSTKR